MNEEIEFDPLFDYTRVQPINLIALEDESSDPEQALGLPPKQGNKAQPVVSSGVGNPIVCDDEEEEDWLPPPPKTVNVGRNIEDPTIKELRLKKQELASFALSAEDVLRAAEESAKKHLASSREPSLGVEVEKVSKPPVDREKIVISIQDKEGQKQFRIYKDEKFEKIFKLYAERVNRDLGSLVFHFDGDKVGIAATPAGLGMEDEDIIEVHTKSK